MTNSGESIDGWGEEAPGGWRRAPLACSQVSYLVGRLRPWVYHTFVHDSALTGVSGRCGANHPEFSLSSMSLLPLQQGLCPNGSQAQRQLTQLFYASAP